MLIVLRLEERLHMFMLVLIVLLVANVVVLAKHAHLSQDAFAVAIVFLMIIWLIAMIVSLGPQPALVSVFAGTMMMVNMIIIAPRHLREYLN